MCNYFVCFNDCILLKKIGLAAILVPFCPSYRCIDPFFALQSSFQSINAYPDIWYFTVFGTFQTYFKAIHKMMKTRTEISIEFHILFSSIQFMTRKRKEKKNKHKKNRVELINQLTLWNNIHYQRESLSQSAEGILSSLEYFLFISYWN